MNKQNIQIMIDTFKRLHHAPLPEYENKGFDMHHFGHTCGSPCCIGGWVNTIFNADTKFNNKTCMSIAGSVLGIGRAQQRRLFFAIDYSGLDFSVPNGLQSADFTLPAAIRVLEILRDTGRVDWNEAIANPWTPDEEPKTDWASLVMIGGLDGLPEGPKRITYNSEKLNGEVG